MYKYTCETRGDPLQIYNAVAMHDLCSIYHYFYTAQNHHRHHHHRQQQKYIAHVAIQLLLSLLRQQRSGIDIPLLPTYYIIIFYVACAIQRVHGSQKIDNILFLNSVWITYV